MNDLVSIDVGKSVAEIRSGAEPAKPSEIADTVGLLLATMRRRNQSETEVRLEVEAFILACEDKPKSAIAAAAKAFLQGKVEGASKTFMPAAPEFAQEAERQFWLNNRANSLPTSDTPPPKPKLNENHFSSRWDRGDIPLPDLDTETRDLSEAVASVGKVNLND